MYYYLYEFASSPVEFRNIDREGEGEREKGRERERERESEREEEREREEKRGRTRWEFSIVHTTWVRSLTELWWCCQCYLAGVAESSRFDQVCTSSGGEERKGREEEETRGKSVRDRGKKRMEKESGTDVGRCS